MRRRVLPRPVELPLPHNDLWNWQLHAACRGFPSNMFFHSDGDRGRKVQERERRAKQICSVCPVARECLDHAMTVREPFGVWGGLSEIDRYELRAAADSEGRR